MAPFYEYEDDKGHKWETFLPLSQYDTEQHCSKCGKLGHKLISVPMINGTRDSFGIGKDFYHKGKEITNWRDWEKAGYSFPESDGTIKDNEMKELVKEKIQRVKSKQNTRQDFFNKHPHIGGV